MFHMENFESFIGELIKIVHTFFNEYHYLLLYLMVNFVSTNQWRRA